MAKIIRKIQMKTKAPSFFYGFLDNKVLFTDKAWKAFVITDERIEATVARINFITSKEGFKVEAIEEGVI